MPAVYLCCFVLYIRNVNYLDHQVNISLVLITGDWSVGSDHQTAVHLGWQVHMLTCSAAQRGRESREDGWGGGCEETCVSMRHQPCPVMNELHFSSVIFNLSHHISVLLMHSYYYLTAILMNLYMYTHLKPQVREVQNKMYKVMLLSVCTAAQIWIITEMLGETSESIGGISFFSWEQLYLRRKRAVSVPTGSPRIWAPDGRPNRNFFVSWLISYARTHTGLKKINAKTYKEHSR